MSKEISSQTEGGRSFRSWFGLSSKENQDPIIIHINKLLRMTEVKQDSNIKQNLLNLLERHKELLKIESKLTNLSIEQNARNLTSINNNYVALRNREKLSYEKNKRRIKQISKNIFSAIYHKLPKDETRDNLVVLLEISQEELDEQKNMPEAKIVEVLKVTAISHEEATSHIIESVHKVNHDSLLKELLEQFFYKKAAIDKAQKNNIANNKEHVIRLINQKKQILKTIAPEASRLKKLTEAEQQTHATSIKFHEASQHLKDLNIEINAIKNAGVHGLLNELHAVLLNNPNLDALIKELGTVLQQLPEGKLKQALAEVIQPQMNRKGESPEFSQCWSALEQLLHNSNNTKQARTSISHTVIEEDLTIIESKTTPTATKTTVSTSWVASLISPVKRWFQNLWHTKDQTQQSITQQIEEPESTEDMSHDTTQTTTWLQDNFPPKAASWLGNLWQGFKTAIGMKPKPQLSKTITKAQAQLLLEVNQFIENFEQHKVVEKQACLANCQRLIKQLEQQLPHAQSSMHARQKLQAMISDLRLTLTTAPEAQKKTATETDVEHISLKKR